MWGHPDFRNAAFGCVGCGGVAGGGLLAAASAVFPEGVPAGAAVAVAAGGAIVFGLTVYRQRRVQCRLLRYQLGRCKRAVRIARETMAGRNPTEPYFVYLRPFAIDGAFVEAPRGRVDEDVVERYGIPTAGHDLESALALLVQEHGELLALSNELGGTAGKIRSHDDRWKDEVAALCEHAEGIFVVPFDFEGTAWEVSRIQSTPSWLAKALFIMPALPPVAWLTRAPDYREMWEAGRERYRELDLPEYDERGGVVVFRDDSPVVIHGFGKTLFFPSLAVAKRNERGLEELRQVIAELAAASSSSAS